jgi:hypothetical protein
MANPRKPRCHPLRIDCMSLVARLITSRARFAFWALAGATLLVSHNAVFLAQTGPGAPLAEALRDAGHGYWGVASIGLALIGSMGALGTVLRVRHLRRRAALLRAAASPMRPRAYLTRSLRCWIGLFVLVAIGFAIQENVEHLVAHGHILGSGALIGPAYPLALPVIAAISLLAGLVAGAFASVERDLLVRIEAAIRRLLARAPRRLVRPPARLHLAPPRVLAIPGAGRAPPALPVPQS